MSAEKSPAGRRGRRAPSKSIGDLARPKRGESSTPRDPNEEVLALIETLHEADQRLDDITAGEVDTVVGPDGRSFLLRRAQDRLRSDEVVKQAALLNTLPAHIALLDPRGCIVSVNEAWRQFAGAGAVQEPVSEIGVNYLDRCDRIPVDDPSRPDRVAAGIRSVLKGALGHFSMEYSHPSAIEQRWFSLLVTPLGGKPPTGAIVMHQDITEQHRAKDALRESERRFSDMLGNVELVSLMLDRAGLITYCNDYLLRLTGWRREELMGQNWFELFIPPDIVDMPEHYAALLANLPEAWHHENEILTRAGERRLIRWNNSVLRSSDGAVIGTAAIGEDITEQRASREWLRRNEEHMRLILESVGEGIYGIDIEGNVFFFNPGAEKMLGYGPGELAGKHSHSTMHHSRNDGTPYLLEDCPVYRSMRYGVVRRVEDEVFWRKDGSSFPVEYTTAPIRNVEQALIGAVVAFRDITDRKEAESKITRLNRVYAVRSDINALIVRMHDRIELFNEACRIAVDVGHFQMAWVGVIDPQTQDGKVVGWHGVAQDDVDSITLTAREGAPDSDGPASRALRSLQPVICNDVATDRVLAAQRDDLLKKGCKSVGCFPLQVNGRPEGVLTLFASQVEFFDHEETQLLLALTGDLSYALDHIEKETQLNYLSYYDLLTGLANRSLFLERMAQYMLSAVSAGHPLALFLIDLERFKNINDSLGQSAGDALLRQVAEWLTRIVGNASLLARVGADHFAVVLPEVKPEGNLVALLEKTIEVLLGHPFRLNDAVFRIGAKIGVALFPEDGADADTLYKHAETALKLAKTSGVRYLFYKRQMSDAVVGKPSLENQLRQALDLEQFVLYYQPKTNLRSGRITGAEALIRWNDPRKGLVPPGRFIPLLEETGLIHEVGRWALRKSIDDYLRWRKAGRAAVRIAVNVSPLQLRHRDFISEIGQALKIDSHAAAGLELEITESVLMEDIANSIASLKAIRAMGVTLAIDDFGTGFSSLSYLSKLPVDTLKIDRSFVIDMTAAARGSALMSTIINLAHALKLNVVAEGVETEEQSRLLHAMHCDEMQGFLFSKPVPADVFEAKFLQ
jgi:diguanylate cyclase (GGDEF)-like protein/PAS domain S-box-containing protein